MGSSKPDIKARVETAQVSTRSSPRLLQVWFNWEGNKSLQLSTWSFWPPLTHRRPAARPCFFFFFNVQTGCGVGRRRPVYPSKETISGRKKERNVSRGRWQEQPNPPQLSARLVIALFMLVIISSKVRAAAHGNYTCAAICAWIGGGGGGGSGWRDVGSV